MSGVKPIKWATRPRWRTLEIQIRLRRKTSAPFATPFIHDSKRETVDLNRFAPLHSSGVLRSYGTPFAVLQLPLRERCCKITQRLWYIWYFIDRWETCTMGFCRILYLWILSIVYMEFFRQDEHERSRRQQRLITVQLRLWIDSSPWSRFSLLSWKSKIRNKLKISLSLPYINSKNIY